MAPNASLSRATSVCELISMWTSSGRLVIDNGGRFGSTPASAARTAGAIASGSPRTCSSIDPRYKDDSSILLGMSPLNVTFCETGRKNIGRTVCESSAYLASAATPTIS